ncbi:translation initiation factor IF-2-like [Schistocerca gregaria]|uniref:translation initiation factor IF-2-like n=1 Tax=Schistocerca gregaria TaxID=7010 RepID=UPI00211E05D0|nr:translation initiation factor IF-2-like [Schistocerca gregaria]
MWTAAELPRNIAESQLQASTHGGRRAHAAWADRALLWCLWCEKRAAWPGLRPLRAQAPTSCPLVRKVASPRGTAVAVPGVEVWTDGEERLLAEDTVLPVRTGQAGGGPSFADRWRQSSQRGSPPDTRQAPGVTLPCLDVTEPCPRRHPAARRNRHGRPPTPAAASASAAAAAARRHVHSGAQRPVRRVRGAAAVRRLLRGRRLAGRLRPRRGGERRPVHPRGNLHRERAPRGHHRHHQLQHPRRRGLAGERGAIQDPRLVPGGRHPAHPGGHQPHAGGGVRRAAWDVRGAGAGPGRAGARGGRRLCAAGAVPHAPRPGGGAGGGALLRRRARVRLAGRVAGAPAPAERQ